MPTVVGNSLLAARPWCYAPHGRTDKTPRGGCLANTSLSRRGTSAWFAERDSLESFDAAFAGDQDLSSRLMGQGDLLSLRADAADAVRRSVCELS